jgi:hypothetical protein
MSNITIIETISDALILSVDPTIFDDFDADENYNVQINFADSEFDCEHDDCIEQTLPSISFLDDSPVQSIMTNCLAHYPAVNDFVSANR